ncbi:MAG: hypothetical protein RR555_10640 [Bacteroidales bacterium]
MEDTTRGIHCRVGSDRDGNLRRIIVGIEKALEITCEFNEDTGGGILDVDEELESIWGLALIAMQNYINMTCVDCFIISRPSEKLEKFSKKIRNNASKIPQSKYTFVELIYALANAIKHRNELELQCQRILMSYNSDDEKYATEESYREANLKILNAFNLLVPLRDTSSAWEIYPIIKGLEILDPKCKLDNIAEKLFTWANDVKCNYHTKQLNSCE